MPDNKKGKPIKSSTSTRTAPGQSSGSGGRRGNGGANSRARSVAAMRRKPSSNAAHGARSQKGIVPVIQGHLRRAYRFYRKKKVTLQKSLSNTEFDFKRLFMNRSLMLGTIGVLALILLVVMVYAFTKKNSYEVFVGQKSIGILAMSKSITEQNVQDTAVSKLAAELGSNVQVNERVELVPIHSSKSKQSSLDYIVAEIYKTFTYKVEACVITVDGSQIAILRSRTEADDLISKIVSAYKPEDATNIINAGPAENVELPSRYVDPDEVDSYELAHSKLTEQAMVESQYTIRSGDSLWSIASNNNMSMDDIIAMNPNVNLSDPTKLRPGTAISILQPVRLISIKTVEEVKSMEVDVKKEQRIENPDQPRTYSKTIQLGKDGQKEVTYHIIRVNGFLIEKIPVSEQIVTPSEPYIVEVGTGG